MTDVIINTNSSFEATDVIIDTNSSFETTDVVINTNSYFEARRRTMPSKLIMETIRQHTFAFHLVFGRVGGFVLLLSLLGLPKHIVAIHESKHWHWDIMVTPFASMDLPCVAEPGVRKLALGDECTSWGTSLDDYTFSSYKYFWIPHQATHWRHKADQAYSYGSSALHNEKLREMLNAVVQATATSLPIRNDTVQA
jgi:hypothetical protein